ncbi:sensor histidine kinase [Nakamurella lactea]|uniref:sensor histidine kinase n=1 Tax=Nakamurella lactea TaxID=459515 RepID=UPI000401BDE2|nr:HAMP domain-containing sensor histidine kinase [Nakamurella lactea]
MTTYQPQRRRWSLRARLIALVLAVAALALGAVDVLLPMNLRSSMMDEKKAGLQRAIDSMGPRASSEGLSQLSASSALRGDIGWSSVDAQGKTLVVVRVLSDADANPAIPAKPSSAEPATVADNSNESVSYLILASSIPYKDLNGDSVRLVAWTPLADVDSTMGQLIFTELLITAGLLLLLGATSSVIIRRELKPLEAMATAADDIAGGDLDRRVYPGDAGTEVGRLGLAFNGMLDGISELIAERERSEERLRQFLADASHELRTPVAAVRGYTDLYKAGALPDEAAVARAMERMGFEAVRMGALVGDLLTLIQADAEKGERHEPVNVAELLAGVVDDAAVIDRTRQWRLVGTDGVTALVYGDRLRLHQLFANLLANIRTHTEPGTVATVSLSLSASEVAIAVSDNGPGVSDADLPKLFDRFYRVDASRSREKGGTGLGLSIVAAIVRSHRGRIMASHTPGGGLTTVIVLPRWLPQPTISVVDTSAPKTGPTPLPPTTGPIPSLTKTPPVGQLSAGKNGGDGSDRADATALDRNP